MEWDRNWGMMLSVNVNCQENELALRYVLIRCNTDSHKCSSHLLSESSCGGVDLGGRAQAGPFPGCVNCLSLVVTGGSIYEKCGSGTWLI
jgi:hypothetical protein